MPGAMGPSDCRLASRSIHFEKVVSEGVSHEPIILFAAWLLKQYR